MNRSQTSPMGILTRSPLRMSGHRSPRSTRNLSPTARMSPTRAMRSLNSTQTQSTNFATNLINRFPENPTPEAKLRLVFNELDLEGKKQVNLDGFRRTLKALNIAFTTATLEDLFDRADKDKQGSINYSEFLNFSQHYPLLIEAIYSRSRLVVQRALEDGNMQRQREKQEELHRAERLLQQQWDVAKDELSAQQRLFEETESAMKNTQQNLKDRNQELVARQSDLDRAKAERTVKERDLGDARDAERLALKPLRDMERNLDRGLEQLTQREIQLDALREKERHLELMLEETKQEIQRTNDFMTETSDSVAEMRERVAELATTHEEAQSECGRLNQEFQDADAEVRSLRQNVEMMELIKNDTAAQLKQYRTTLEEHRNTLIPYRQREAHQKALHADGLKVLTEADNALANMEREMEASDVARVEAENIEHALLENEVRLREQRSNLNERDDVLWTEGGEFLQHAQRSDTRVGTTNGRTRGI